MISECYFIILLNRYADGIAVGLALPQEFLAKDTWTLYADRQALGVALKVSGWQCHRHIFTWRATRCCHA
jgi:hypothetical protein